MLKGALLVDIRRYNIAFQEFKLAHEMCPNRFMPLYNMYVILRRCSQKSAQVRLGRAILKKTVKVPSYEIKELKKEITNDLNAIQL